jgi:uncharacterized protein
MLDFVYQLHTAGIPISIQYIVDFYRALKRGLAADVDQLFLLARLIFVKKLQHMDLFERVFATCFMGDESVEGCRDGDELLAGKPLQEWLREQLEAAQLAGVHELDTETLLARFWETLQAQRGEHRGGGTWIGTGGTSPFGHGGRKAGGIRVFGKSLHGTAAKVIGRHNFISYADQSMISAENLGQTLNTLKSLRPLGPLAELDMDETIARTARNAGEIELVFQREKRNRVQLMVLLDNGGYSMIPYIPLVKIVFGKIRDLFRDLQFYYFHNCIYGEVFRDTQRSKAVPWESLLSMDKSTRILVIGDANMAPAELMAASGSLGMFRTVRKPGWEWLKELREAFPASVWLNPIPRSHWGYGSTTIRRIGGLFQMEELSLGGIKSAVSHLNLRGQSLDRD